MYSNDTQYNFFNPNFPSHTQSSPRDHSSSSLELESIKTQPLIGSSFTSGLSSPKITHIRKKVYKNIKERRRKRT